MESATLILKVDSTGAKSASRDLDQLEKGGKRAERAASQLGIAWGKAIGTIASGYAVQKATRAFIQMADASANMSARLRLATTSQAAFNKAHSETFAIAQRTSTELASVVDLYAKLDQSTRSLGVSQGDLLSLTETITQTFQISGASAQEASGGLRQLSQAMAGGVLRAEEFNSIIESSPRLVQAMADGMGIEFGKVRQYVNDGKISSEALVNALLSQSEAIQSEFDQMPITVGRAIQEVRNALTRLVGDADEAEGASKGLAEAIEDVAEALSDPRVKEGFAAMVSGAASVTAEVVKGTGLITNYIAQYHRLAELRLGNVKPGDSGNVDDLNARLAQVGGALGQIDKGLPVPGEQRFFETYKGMHQRLKDERLALIRAITEQNRDDSVAGAFAGTPREMDFTRGAPELAGGGATEEIEDRITKVKELTAAEKAHNLLMEEVAAHDQVATESGHAYANMLNDRRNAAEDAAAGEAQATAELLDAMQFEYSLIGLSNVEREKAIALRYANVDATSAEGQAIGELIEKMDRAREARGLQDEMEDSARSLFGTIATDSDRASQALDRFFDNLKRRLAEKTFDALLAGLGGMAGGGGWAGFGQAFTGSFSGQRAAGGPVMGGQAYLVGEEGPEVVTFGQSGRVHPMGPAHGGGKQAMTVHIHNAPAGTEARQSTGPDGGLQLDVLIGGIKREIAGDVASGGSVAQAMKGRFGLREAI